MVIGKVRRACKRGLSIAIAAAVMATSAPQLSVTAMAREEGMAVSAEISGQAPAEVTTPDDTEGEESKGEDSAQDSMADEDPADQGDENEMGEGKNDSGKAEDNAVENPDQETDPDAKDETDSTDDEDDPDAEGDADDEEESDAKKDGGEDKEEAEPEQKLVEVEKKVYYAPTQSEENAVEGKVFFEENFDRATSLQDVVDVNGSMGSAVKDDNGTVLASIAELEAGSGNKAIKFTTDLSATTEWKDIFKVQLNLPEEFADTIDTTNGKVVMSYDLYFPTESVKDDFGTMTAQPGLKSGTSWKWVTEKKGSDYSAAQFQSSDVEGYKVFHVTVDMNDFKTWVDEENKDVDFAFSDIIPIKAVIPCLAGNTSKYTGDIYLDNVKVRAVGVSNDGGDESGSDKPTDPVDKKVLFRNDFDDLESLDGVLQENVQGATYELTELATGNKAVKYTVDLPGKGTWEEIFKPEIKLSQSYTTPIKGKVVMSYDVYLPSSVITFSSKAQAAFKCGEDQAWVSQDSYPAYTQDNFKEDGQVTGFKKIHVEIAIDNLKKGSDSYSIEQFTPLHAVIPCFVGVETAYKGDVYLDNVELRVEEESSGEENPPLEGELIYKQNFNDLTSLDKVLKENVSGRTPELAELSTDNKAVKYTISALSGGGWDDIFKAEFTLAESYEKAITDKVIMSYDVYFPSDSVTGGMNGTFDSMKAQAALKSGAKETWVSAKLIPQYTAENLVEDASVPGFKKAHIVVNMTDFETWDGSANVAYPFEDITPVKAVIPCLAGSGSTYAGDLYLDNLEVRAVSKSEEENPPTVSKELIYENNFNELESLKDVLAENVSGRIYELAELASDNKAVKYTVSKLPGNSWDDVFKAQFNLAKAYDKKINSKVVMSYDIYFPAASVATEGFDMFKTQATIACGSEWVWATQKTWPEIKAAELQDDADVPGFKKAHVEIDMKDFQTYDNDLKDNKPYPFEDITPIQAVIPCLAGAGSTYEGDIYLDNLKVWAVNETEEIPDVEGDLVLNLDASAWSLEGPYQYTGDSKIENKTVGDKKFLVATVDFSKDTHQGWSEPKFGYTHDAVVPSLKGYNAFIADVYYKPANKTAGSFGIKLYANDAVTGKEGIINNDAAIPEGEPVTIDGLEGYYKAEFVLEKKFEGAFQNLTFSIVGKNTDYVGDFYLDNMRFTKITAPEVYVTSTILPKKGAGIRVVDEGRNIQTASGKKFAIAENVALVDAEANDATKNLYAYLKAVGESDSVIFGHQNDTHHKAGSTGEGFSTSDTKDVTGSIAGVVGIDALSLTGNEASTWDTPEAERIAKVAQITREAASEGAIVTLSAHMPNFDIIDKRVKAYEAGGESATNQDDFGYWKSAEDGTRQYNFSGYTPGTLTGNVVTRVMPGQDLNYLYTDYLDLIADYAKAVEGDGITILFRPLHENTGSWFWWGAALCDEQAYINLYRYTVDYLKETRGVHNILYVYGPGSEAANAAEYGARYPGDAYVDMIGYDMYHSNPSQENEDAFLSNIKSQNAILREFAAAHDKLYAITETGVADGDVALKRTGNDVKEWYMRLLDALDGEGVSYFLVWANFSENGSFYLPYVIEKKEDGYLYGHEMLDEFIKFYNDERSVFATDMNSEFKNIKGVTNTTAGKKVVSGYITSPSSGDRILPSKNGEGTRITAKVTGIAASADVRYVVTTASDECVLAASYSEQEGIWTAVLKDSALKSLGEGLGTIALLVNNEELSVINARFNMVEVEQDDLTPDDFEGYNGSSQQLGLAWATNKDTGSEITLSLTDDKEKVFGGDYGLQMDVTLLNGNAWAGATKSFEADWSAGNALEFYTIPEKNGQKVVVQVTCGGQVFEVYLQEFPAYTSSADSEIPVKVTIPFSAFTGRDNAAAKFDPNHIESIGLWCNAIAQEGVSFPLRTTLYYDEIKVVDTTQTNVSIEATAKEGIWFKAIPNQTYTGAAIKPEVEVYDNTKPLTYKKDYTLTYRNNVKVGSEAKVIIHGKGNYKQKIEAYFVIEPKELNAGEAQAPEYMIYDGKEQNINVVVRDGRKRLSSKNDYTQVITYNGQEVTTAKETGKYNIKITGKNNYKGEINLSCEMVADKILLSDATVQLRPTSLSYNDGKPVTYQDSQIVVKLNKKVVPQQENGVANYEISYENNTQPGTATVVIRAGQDSKYVGSCRKDFTVKGLTFSTGAITMSGFKAKVDYTGKPAFQNVVLTDKKSKDELEKNEDYSITYENHVNAGKATMIITGLGKYSGTIKKTYTISKIKLKADMIGAKTIEAEQNRAGATPDVTLTYQGNKLVKDRDYKLTYTNNKNITTNQKKAYISISGIGNYTGKINKAVELQIKPKSWQSSDITVEVPDVKYYNFKSSYTPNPVVRDNGTALVKGQDYTVTYEANTKEDIGDITQKPNGHVAKAIITVKGSDYTGTEDSAVRTVEFRIAGRMISDARATVKNPQYFSQRGTWPKEEDLEVKYKGEIVNPTEYEIISRDTNTNRGRRTLVIRGKGQYGGTKKVVYLVQAKGIYDNWTQEAVQVLSNVLEAIQ